LLYVDGVTSGTPELSSEDLATYRLYWQVQYERVAQHENGRYQVSSFVIAGSLVAAGLITQAGGGLAVRWTAAIAIAFINGFAMVYIAQERKWVKLHQARAAAALERMSPALVELQTTANDELDIAVTSQARQSLWRSANMLMAMHGVLCVAVLVVAAVE
jgi:hypothetical protein